MNENTGNVISIANALRKIAAALGVPKPAGIAAPKELAPVKLPGAAKQDLKGMPNPVSFKTPK